MKASPPRAVGPPCVLLCLLLPLLFVAALAAPAEAQNSWSGSGPYTISSTPSNPPCTGQGTARISLEGSGSSVTGTLTFTLTSQSSGCVGRLTSGGTAYLTGTLYGSALQATDQEGDTYTGTLSGGSLSLKLTTPPASSNCVAYCKQVASFSFTGSGNMGGSLALLPMAAAGTAAVFGLAGIAAAAASLRAPRQFRSHEGFSYKFDNGVFTRLDGPAPSGFSAPAAPPAPAAAPPVSAPPGPPAPAPPSTPVGSPIVGGGEAITGGGASVGTPDLAPNPDPPLGLDQTSGGPSCPVHRGPCIPALKTLGTGPAIRWFCPVGGHYPWG